MRIALLYVLRKAQRTFSRAHPLLAQPPSRVQPPALSGVLPAASCCAHMPCIPSHRRADAPNRDICRACRSQQVLGYQRLYLAAPPSTPRCPTASPPQPPAIAAPAAAAAPACDAAVSVALARRASATAAAAALSLLATAASMRGKPVAAPPCCCAPPAARLPTQTPALASRKLRCETCSWLEQLASSTEYHEKQATASRGTSDSKQ